MERHTALIFGITSYIIALATITYLFLFIGNLLVPNSVDASPAAHWFIAIITNTALILMFALQHSIMARKSFKRIWLRFIPACIERSTYVLCTSIVLASVLYFWEPIGGTIWLVEHPIGAGILRGMYAFGWITVLVAIWLTNHFELFGIRQVWLFFRKQSYTQLPFTTRWMYRYIRHPLYLGWLFAFWSTPHMTIGHLFFALLLTAYIVAAIPFEEEDLIEDYGDQYRDYRERVPKMIPTVSYKSERDTYVLNQTGEYIGPSRAKGAVQNKK